MKIIIENEEDKNVIASTLDTVLKTGGLKAMPLYNYLQKSIIQPPVAPTKRQPELSPIEEEIHEEEESD